MVLTSSFPNVIPFITKDGSLSAFKTVSVSEFNSDFIYGDLITGSYENTASISSVRYVAGSTRRKVDALRNALNSYGAWSRHFLFSSSLGNKGEQELRLFGIPYLYFGSRIEKGTISLKFYVTGALAAELVDDKHNGELRQKLPADANSGSVAGIALYNEGFLILTGTWAIHPTHTENYDIFAPSSSISPRWVDFGTTGSGTPGDLTNVASSSFGMKFNGTTFIPVVTMLAHAGKGEFNYSSNPTFIDYTERNLRVPVTGTKSYRERSDISLKNTVESPFIEPTGSFQKQTFISRIGVYDKNRNLIAIGKTARPIRKREVDNYTFKIKIDF